MVNPDFTNNPKDAWLYLLTRKDRTVVEVSEVLVANDRALAQGFKRLSELTESETAALEQAKLEKHTKTVDTQLATQREENAKK